MAGTAESTVNAGESNGCEAPRESWTTTRITVSVELNPLGVHGTIWGFVGPAAKDLMAWLAPPPKEYETLIWTGSPSGSVTSKEMSWVFPAVQDVAALRRREDRSGPGLPSGCERPSERVDVESEGELRRLRGLRKDEGKQGGRRKEDDQQQDRCAESSEGGCRPPTHPKSQRLARHQGLSRSAPICTYRIHSVTKSPDDNQGEHKSSHGA